MVSGGGESNRVGKQSSLGQIYNEHLRPHDSVGTGEWVGMGPVKVAGGWKGGRGKGAAEGPGVENLVRSGASAYRRPSASKS